MTRALGVGTSPSAGKRDEGVHRCRCWRSPCCRLLIQAKSWYILIQVERWRIVPGSGGNCPHCGDASDIGRRASAVQARRRSPGWEMLFLIVGIIQCIFCCLSFGEGDIYFLLYEGGVAPCGRGKIPQFGSSVLLPCGRCGRYFSL